MGFTVEQKGALLAPLHKANVKSREQAGRSLSYIEAWWAISEANRIFGHDAWDRETVDLRQLGEPRLVQDKFRVGYACRVRITVTTADRIIIREGCGFGSGIDRDSDQAHESALKEAESDAMKRALMTFGNPFGLALYDKTQANVTSEKPELKNRDFGPSATADDFQGAEGVKGKSAYAAKKDGTDKRFTELRNEIPTLESLGACTCWANANADEIKEMPESWRRELRGELDNHKAFIRQAEGIEA